MSGTDGALLNEITRVIHLNNRELAELLGISRRTMQRVIAHESDLSGPNFAKMARAVHPKNPELAARVAQRAGTTLEALGLVSPSPQSPSPPPVAPPVVEQPKPAPPHPRLADSVVDAAADVMDLAPRAIRPALRAAFRRAGELGLSIDMLCGALEDAEPTKPASG